MEVEQKEDFISAATGKIFSTLETAKELYFRNPKLGGVLDTVLRVTLKLLDAAKDVPDDNSIGQLTLQLEKNLKSK